MNQTSVKGYQGAVSNTLIDIPSASSCRFAMLDIGNNNAAVSYVQVFNLPAASVTLGTTAPLLSFEVPANSGRTVNPGILLNFGGSGMCIAGTTGRANSTAPSTALDVNLAY